jgi:predicted CopG family antitoxin
MPMITIRQELKTELDNLKTHRRDTYGDVIGQLVAEHKQMNSNN